MLGLINKIDVIHPPRSSVRALSHDENHLQLRIWFSAKARHNSPMSDREILRNFAHKMAFLKAQKKRGREERTKGVRRNVSYTRLWR